MSWPARWKKFNTLYNRPNNNNKNNSNMPVDSKINIFVVISMSVMT